MTASKPLSDFDQEIVDLVRQHWDDTHLPFLLSQLGNRKDGKIAKEVKEKADGLAAYLRQELADHIDVVRHSINHPLIGAIPADANIPDCNVDVLFNKIGDRSKESPTRFHSAVWTAFRKPLRDDMKRRYISVQTPFRFQDIESEAPPDGSVEIDRNSILGFDAEAVEVQESIQKWLAAKKIDQSRFLATPSKIDKTQLSDNLLARLLEALGPEELRRISMPLDVVDKLRRESL